MHPRRRAATAAAALLLAIGAPVALPAASHASDAGAFIGGVLASKVLDNMQRRTAAEETMAYSAPRATHPVPQAAPAAPASSPQQKLQQLDALAGGGYITPEEYKTRRQAILDAM